MSILHPLDGHTQIKGRIMKAKELSQILMENPEADVVIVVDGEGYDLTEDDDCINISKQGKFDFINAPNPSPYFNNDLAHLYDGLWIDLAWGRIASGTEPLETRTIIEIG